MAVGLRHGRGCKRATGCKCPWEASVYIKRDGKKIRRTAGTRVAAAAWRAGILDSYLARAGELAPVTP